MNLALILRDSWRITWKNLPLWVLALLMFLAFVPAGVLSLSFSMLASAVTFDDPMLRAIPEWQALLAGLRAAPAFQWVGLAAAAIVLLVVTTSATLMLQAASMRGVIAAAEGGRASLGHMFRLGRTRAGNIVKLSALFGCVSALIGVLPSLALLLIGGKSPLGVSLVQLAQTGLTPVSMALNIFALLLIMSIALEDFSPRAAFGRAGNVFKTGWWAFLLIFVLSGAAVVTSALIIVVPPIFVAPVAFIAPEAGIYLTLGTCGCGGIAAVFFFLFTVVFTQALYALVYREAARLAQAR